ncbi:glycosyltransferase 87 family protein [Streptomyces longispororuber]|nr:glycosyltransferase 87 family protein [Streptomyces longispororuber]MCQ4210023.1 glycosyltransferase 87 family protein [Streptomyces longispororuber]
MKTAQSPLAAWLLRPAPGAARAVLALVLAVIPVHAALKSPGSGVDNRIVVHAARLWLAGGSPYADPHFLYFPSAVLAAVPQALAPTGVLRVAVPVLVTGGLVAGWACALRVYGVAWRSRFAVAGLLALALGSAPFAHLVHLANWTVTAAAALPCALLLATRGRWLAAGLVIGAALALKPLLAPVALLFVLARQWRGLAALVAVPAGASAAAALAMPDPAGFFTRTLPFLLRGDDAFVRLYEASPGAVLTRLGVPPAAAALVAAAGAAAGLWCARRRWRRGDEGVRRPVETAVMLLLSAFLVSRPSYDHYLLVVVPLLLAGALEAGAPARGPWFWAVLLPQVPGPAWPWLDTGERRAFLDCAALCGLALVAGLHCARRGPVTLEPRGTTGTPTVPGSRDDHVLTRPGQRGYPA